MAQCKYLHQDKIYNFICFSSKKDDVEMTITLAVLFKSFPRKTQIALWPTHTELNIKCSMSRTVSVGLDENGIIPWDQKF